MKEFPDIEKYLPKDSINYQRLLNFQEKAKRNGYRKGHLWMAGLAAFPVFLSPDLLYKLWLNFRHITYQDGRSLNIDRMAVSDLLLSTLVEEVAVEVFKIRPQIRIALLALLEKWSLSLKGGEDFIKRLADFTLRYVRSYQMEGESVSTAIREAQGWNALAYFNPNAAATELSKALSQAVASNAKQKVLRISLMLSEMDEQFKQLGQKEQQEQFRTLVNYGQGMRSLIRGQKEEAIQAFQRIERQVKSIEEDTKSSHKVRLPIPKEIYQAISHEAISTAPLESFRVFVLLVGIGEYNSATDLPSLPGVQADLEFWQGFFADQIEGLIQVNTLLNGAATKEAVLESLQLECRKAMSGDQVFFFFSGYGQNQVQGKEDNALFLYDYQVKPEVGKLSEREFNSTVEAILPEGASFTLVLDTPSGGRNWVDTDKAGRYIYNACDVHENAQQSLEGGLFTRAFKQTLIDIGSLKLTHVGLLGRLRSTMKHLSNESHQTATWYGAGSGRTQSFLGQASLANLRLRELLVETGWSSSILAADIDQIVHKFRREYHLEGHLSIERVLSSWALLGSHKTLNVFLSQSLSATPTSIRYKVEDILLAEGLPYRLFSFDLPPLEDNLLEGDNIAMPENWKEKLEEAHLFIIQIDEDWISHPTSHEIVHKIELRLMEQQIPLLLLYIKDCDWNSHPIQNLGTPWPNQPILQADAEQRTNFNEDLPLRLKEIFTYFRPFLIKPLPKNKLRLELDEQSLVDQLLEALGQYFPDTVAALATQSEQQQKQFIAEHFPANIGKGLQTLFAEEAPLEKFSALLDTYSDSIRFINRLLLSIAWSQLEKQPKPELAEVLISGLRQEGWLDKAATLSIISKTIESEAGLSATLAETQWDVQSLESFILDPKLPNMMQNEEQESEDSPENLHHMISHNYNQLTKWLCQLGFLMGRELIGIGASEVNSQFPLKQHILRTYPSISETVEETNTPLESQRTYLR